VLMTSLLLMTALSQEPPPQPVREAPTVRLEPQTYLSGAVTLVATLAPADVPFARVDFLVDGAVKCRVTALPLTCAHDFGAAVRRHRVQVVVTLPTEERLTNAFESKELALDETVSVQNVFLPVVVTDREGHFINGLTQQSFEVLEDDVAQPVQFFAAENAPLELALAIDISESMTPLIEPVKAAAKSFMLGLRPTDHVNLLAFNQRVFVLTSAQDTPPAEKAVLVDRLRPAGGTALFDAVAKGATLLSSQMRRRAIIVFSDGRDEHSVSTLEQIDDDLARRDATLYVIAYGKVMEGPAAQQRERLFRLAERTGGRGFTLEKIGHVQRAFVEILATLSHHYLLGYTPTRPDMDGQFRRLTVRLTDRKATAYRVRARAGYRAVPRPPA